jgi:glycine dehydrogenase subunit 1
MNSNNDITYPYIPNSEPAVKKKMLEEVGAASTEEFFEDVPLQLRVRDELDLPKPFLSEAALQRHIQSMLAKNKTTGEYLSFLGAGCWQHYVPAVCDEVNRRSEFLTAYAGEPYEDHGRFQALFEYTSMMGELLNMDVVNVPTYDGFQAAATALRMACRITGRKEVFLAKNINPFKASKIIDYCKPDIAVGFVGYEPATGQLDIAALEKDVSNQTSAVYFDNPAHLGVIETKGLQIADLVHRQGAILVVGTDPISLGILSPPADYGADIVCGDIQPLGMHLQFGGGHGGFIATHDEEEYLMEFPSRLFGIAPTMVPGEYGFGDVAFERTSFAVREKGKEWVGTAAALWGITAGVYLALMGPQGMVELGEGIMTRAAYTMHCLAKLKGIKAPGFQAPHFKEFVVDFSNTGKTVTEINRALLDRGIFGGYDLSGTFSELGQSALYCVTELHTQDDIDRLAKTISEVV